MNIESSVKIFSPLQSTLYLIHYLHQNIGPGIKHQFLHNNKKIYKLSITLTTNSAV